jgi:Mlc titration factor MtfA (ptsG expression regulator)
MLQAIRRWKQKRVLARSGIPDLLWREALERLPFLAIYTEAELERLRDKVVLFLVDKSIVAANGYAVTPLMRVVIALQACVLVLNLDMHYFDGWENVIVYPDEFIVGYEYVDEAGVVHTDRTPLAGEAQANGPVILSWSDIEAGSDWSTAGMNLVIHEFAHKLDMRSGEANGCPPLPREMAPRAWTKTMNAAYEHFRERVDSGAECAIDPYAAASPAEFFAVISEVFFSDPTLLLQDYPQVYELLMQFYRQDPASRAELLLDT